MGHTQRGRDWLVGAGTGTVHQPGREKEGRGIGGCSGVLCWVARSSWADRRGLAWLALGGDGPYPGAGA
jgi:hypothetical protein